MKEARFWEVEGDRVRCHLCPHNCSIAPLRRGICGVRENREGKLYSMNYGKVSSAHIDPIEKKPLFHFYPGSEVFSLGSIGCTFRCRHCFVPGTFVTTSRGAHRIEEIAGVDREELLTHSGRYKKVKDVFDHHYSGQVCRVKPRYLPEIVCTPEHHFLASVRPSSDNIEKVEAQDLRKDHFVVVPKRKTYDQTRVLDVMAILSNAKVSPLRIQRKITPDLIRRIVEMKASGSTSKQIASEVSLTPTHVRLLFSKIRHQGVDPLFRDIECNLVEENGFFRFTMGHHCIPSTIEVSSKLARLLGLYCAEGCVRKNSSRVNSYDAVFSFGLLEGSYAEEVKAACEELFGAKASISKEQTTLQVHVHLSCVAILLMVLCGADCKTKKVPEIIFKSPPEIVGAFLQGYFDGDGRYKKDHTDATTVSKSLAMGVYELLLNQGVVPGFYQYDPPERRLICGREIKQSTEYIVRVPSAFDFVHGKWIKEYKSFYHEDDDFFFVPVRSVSKQHYEGNVHNFEVEEDHTYTANFAAVCNCQNYTISMASLSEFGTNDIRPEDVTRIALDNDCQGIAFTYNEPTIWHEFAYDACKLAKEKGLYTVYVTNGYIQEEPLRELSPVLDAMNIDVKGFTERFYSKICKAPLEPVLKAVKLAHQLGIHIELTYLVIPGENDAEGEVRSFARWCAELDPKIPVHFSRFHPDYEMSDKPPTPIPTMEMTKRVAQEEGLKFIYLGNVHIPHGEDTYCPNCGTLNVRRVGFTVVMNEAKFGKCHVCGEDLYLVQPMGKVAQAERPATE